ncbi:MAG TPA: multiheme c-type cytochrome, partial [Phycisphaerae bacterium]|nr:multiheme c-type cytochrome [Phycisphaerae bacterium]
PWCGRLAKAAILLTLCAVVGCPFTPPTPSTGAAVVLGYNDLGMHCMNQDFSELMLLPPYNTLHAQVIARGAENPAIISDGVTVQYSVPGNTTSVTKTNFWTYANALLGVNLAPDVGLTGNGLSGTMQPTGGNDWSATGIPLTPQPDTGGNNSYQLASIVVQQNGTTIATTSAVVPVSWEINCNLCHNTPGISMATDILQKHDTLHGTNLVNSKPVLCARCHADAALNLTGTAGVPPLSTAMHSSHASRMGAVSLTTECYACHPGVQTQCLRDVHFSKGMLCNNCHTSMAAVGDPGRRPWVDEPRCGSAGCHQVAGHDYEQANTLFRNSKGHSGVHCEACHGSPHAILPTVVAADNVQAETLQGHAGTIDTCTVCHTQQPEDGFFHRVGEGG